MSTTRQRSDLTPHLHGPRVKAWTVGGLVFFLGRTVYRYLTCTLDRDMGDNATFRHAATEDHRGHPVPRYSQAKWKRLTFRWALTLAVFVWAAGALGLLPSWVWPVYLVTVVGAFSYYGAVAIDRWKARRPISRDLVIPAAEIACRAVGKPFRKREAHEIIQLGDNFMEAPAATVVLPNYHLKDAARKALVTSIGRKLGMGVVEGTWNDEGPTIRALIRPVVGPPREFTFEQARQIIEEGEYDIAHPLIGLSADGPVALDYDNDSPHDFLSGPTGTGKSTTYAFLFAQLMRLGSGTIVLDMKGSEAYDWFDDLPDEWAIYRDEIPDIREALLAIAEEIEFRRRERKAARREGRPFNPPRLDVLIEEANTLAEELAAEWQRSGNEGKDPAGPAMGKIIQTGREYRVHAHYATQRADASVFGGRSGGARRASFQIRLMAKYDLAVWKTLASGLPFQPYPTGQPRGVWTVVADGVATHVRVPRLTYDMATAWVLEANLPDTPMFMGPGVPVLARQPRVIDGEVAKALTTLKGFAQAHPDVIPSLDAIQARSRTFGFPAPVEPGRGPLPAQYAVDELEAFYRIVRPEAVGS